MLLHIRSQHTYIVVLHLKDLLSSPCRPIHLLRHRLQAYSNYETRHQKLPSRIRHHLYHMVGCKQQILPSSHQHLLVGREVSQH